MGTLKMDYTLLLFAITILSIIPYAVDVFAEPGDLLFTIENPGLKKDMFSSSLETLDNLIVVGASAKEVNGIAGAGSLYVFNGTTGELTFTIDNPDPKQGDGFGRNVITTDNYIIVGLNIENKNDVGHKGKIFVFDDAGSLKFTIGNPNGLVYDEWFGGHLGTHGDKIIAGSTFQDSDGKWIYMVHVFDKAGNLQHTLENFESNTNIFGYSVSSFGKNITVYAIDEDANDDIHTNSVHVFDASSGKFQYVIENPDPTKGDFGRHMIEIKNHLAVGTPTHMFDEQVSGTIYLFDDTGKWSSSIDYPESDLSDTGFGGYLAAIGNNIALRSLSDQYDEDTMNPVSDEFYIFDSATGERLLVIDEPQLQDNNRRSFIQYLDESGNIVISGINANDNNPLQKTVFVFEGLEPEAVLADVAQDDAPFFGIFAFFENLFLWITQSSQEKSSLSEQEVLEAMSCPELIERNNSGEPYESKEIRLFAREKTLDCSDVEEEFAVNASCDDIYERYHSGVPYLFEEHKLQTENRLKKCEIGYSANNQTNNYELVERYKNIPEVNAFFDAYENPVISVRDDHVSYFAGSPDDFHVRMNLYFDESFSVYEIDFHCYYQKVHQFELPQEDLTSKIAKYNCMEDTESKNEN
ncbi:MAG: hypothetical protein K5798_09995 [Nitrosopumilus sp.]|uniref:hypothetical protein n=1 Tax=Nitrosopumilus sp. TaxID=2024843 RepID=UPI00242A8D09|nr:hypothetical protein [Nitrosopumilus sp.]MCV0367575.1 hypothetical protein [Nitrosopumilus sp.]